MFPNLPERDLTLFGGCEEPNYDCSQCGTQIRTSDRIYKKSKIFPKFVPSEEMYSDVVLDVNGSKLHVNKGYLSVYSPVFQTMFHSNFKERDAEEIKLNENYDEFLDLLRVIYPCRKPINESNVEYILKLADKYDMRMVIEECEKYLMNNLKMETIKQLELADKYSMQQLLNCCMNTFKDVEKIKQLQGKEEYKTLSAEVKALLLDKLMTLV